MKFIKVWMDLVRKNIAYCIFLVVEVVIVSFILLSMVGKIQAIVDSREIINIFNKIESYYFTPYSYYSIPSEEIDTIIKEAGAKKAIVAEMDMNINGEDVLALGYNEEAFEMLHINPASGEWMDCKKSYSNIPIICVGDKYKVGDVLYSGKNQEIPCSVIGTISKNQYIMWYKQSASVGRAALSDMLAKATVECIVPFECENLKCFSAENVTNYNECGSCFLLFDKAASSRMQNKIGEYGDLTELESMRTNYKTENKEYFIVNGIALAIFSLIMFAGIAGINNMMEIRNEKRLTIYYILGASKRKCMMLEFLRAISPMVIGFVLFVVLYVLKAKEYFVDEHVTINGMTFLFILLYVLVIYCMTCAPFLLRLNKKDFLELYKQKV